MIEMQLAAQFSVQGSRYRRMNPDGSIPTPIWHVTKIQNFDSDTGLTANAGKLKLKIDGAAEVEVDVDFSAAVDTAAVTAAEAVTAIVAGLTTAGIDADWTVTAAGSGRVTIAYDGAGSPVYVQWYGDVAGVLGIGNTLNGSELGTRFIKHFTDQTGLTRAKNINEGEEVLLESGDGSLWVVNTSTILKGETLTSNLVKDDGEFKELIMGGVWVEGGDLVADSYQGRYTPPNTDDTVQPKFMVETFIAKYKKGFQDRTDLIGYAFVQHLNCTGIEGDLSNEAKAWATKAYNIKAFEYTDPNTSVKQSAYKEDDINLVQFEGLDPVNV